MKNNIRGKWSFCSKIFIEKNPVFQLLSLNIFLQLNGNSSFKVIRLVLFRAQSSKSFGS